MFGVVAVGMVAVWLRVRSLGSTSVLQDTIGPYWAAVRMDGRAHAPGYGVAMLLPYWVLSKIGSSLWGTTNAMACIQAMVAPVGALCAVRRVNASPVAAIAVGLVLAIDPGAISSTQSGAEGYLAPLFVALAWGLSGSWAWIAFAFAVANHPLAAVALPFMVRKDALCRPAAPGFMVACLLIGHQLYGLSGHGVPGVSLAASVLALWGESHTISIAMAFGPVAGLWFASARKTSLAALVAIALLATAGAALGYLRDHHWRLLSVPVLACWAAGGWVGVGTLLAALIGLKAPESPPEVAHRAGTLSLNHAVVSEILAQGGPTVVDRVWVSGGPGAEPAAIMLDLYLRGWREDDLNLKGDIVVVLAADEVGTYAIPKGAKSLIDGHGFRVFRASLPNTREWSLRMCDEAPRVGGAWDALSVIHPLLPSHLVSDWWECERT